jgi:UDPglucose 6-dehydrogenase
MVVIQKLQEKLRILKGRTVGLLGLAFKPDTDDLRDAPSLAIAERLIQMDVRVRVYDPVAMPACRQQYPGLKVRYCESAEELATGSDALVLVTEWQEFRNLDLARLARVIATPSLVDGRNVFNPANRGRRRLRLRGRNLPRTRQTSHNAVQRTDSDPR